MLVNRATEYLDNGERILPPTIKQLSTLYENGCLKDGSGSGIEVVEHKGSGIEVVEHKGLIIPFIGE